MLLLSFYVVEYEINAEPTEASIYPPFSITKNTNTIEERPGDDEEVDCKCERGYFKALEIFIAIYGAR